MGKKILSLVMIALMATIILSVQPSARAQITEVKIGWSMPMSGPLAGTAFVHHLYYWMVIDDFNAMGGLYVPEVGDRVNITYKALDDAYDTGTMLDNYEYLVFEWGAHLLFAPWSTAHNVAMMTRFESWQYPVVGLTVGSNSLQNYLMSHPAPWFFVTLGQPREDAQQLIEVFQYINSKVSGDLKIDEVGIAYRSDEHGEEHAEAIKAGLESIGIAVTVYEAYDPSRTIDWAAIVDDFRTEDVDVCILCGYGEVAGFVWQCITENYNPKLIFHGPALETSFLVYGTPEAGGFGFNPGLMAGLMYYNGFPASAYKSPLYQQWYQKHKAYTYAFYGGAFPYGYPPFPASAVFYAGVECLLRAAEKAGLTNRTGIRAELNYTTFEITLGLGTTVGTLKFRSGLSPIIAEHGTTTQWTGGEMMDVIWPIAQHSYPWIIYPKFPWDWGYEPDVDRNGKVEMIDIYLVKKDFGWVGPPYEKRTDIDYCRPKLQMANGKVEMIDVWIAKKGFGHVAPSGGIIRY